jgi:hypothetical protein
MMPPPRLIGFKALKDLEFRASIAAGRLRRPGAWKPLPWAACVRPSPALLDHAVGEASSYVQGREP